MMDLDFSKCKTPEDVDKVFEEKKEELDIAQGLTKLFLEQHKEEQHRG